MRPIPSDILAKINEVNQSLYKDANPIIEATMELIQYQLQAQEVYTFSGEVGRIDFCARRENPDDSISEMFFIVVLDGNAYIYRSYIISKKHGVRVVPYFSWEGAEDVACEFDGEWQLNSSSERVFVTKSEPIFARLHQGSLYTKHGSTGIEEHLLDGLSSTDTIALIRGWENTIDFSGIYAATLTVHDPSANPLSNVGISIRKAFEATLHVQDETPSNLDGVKLVVEQTAGNQGVVLAYTENGIAKSRYKRDWVADWSSERLVDLPENMENINAFRGYQEGTLGYLGEANRRAYVSIGKNYSHTSEGNQFISPGQHHSIVEQEAKTNGYYIHNQARIMETTIEHDDWENVSISMMDTVYVEANINYLKVKDLYDGEVWLVWSQQGDDPGFFVGKLPKDEVLEDYLVAEGFLGMPVDTPITQIGLDIEAVPPRLPKVGKPWWDTHGIIHGIIHWEDIDYDPTDYEITPREVTFHVVDTGTANLENVEISVTKEW